MTALGGGKVAQAAQAGAESKQQPGSSTSQRGAAGEAGESRVGREKRSRDVRVHVRVYLSGDKCIHGGGQGPRSRREQTPAVR